MPANVTRVRLKPASAAQRAQGLQAWVSFVVEPLGLLIDGVALRRSQAGEYVWSWPARQDRAGRTHHHVRPLDDAARREVEADLLEAVRPLLPGGRE